MATIGSVGQRSGLTGRQAGLVRTGVERISPTQLPGNVTTDVDAEVDRIRRLAAQEEATFQDELRALRAVLGEPIITPDVQAVAPLPERRPLTGPLVDTRGQLH